MCCLVQCIHTFTNTHTCRSVNDACNWSNEEHVAHQSSAATSHELHVFWRHCASFSMSEAFQVGKLFDAWIDNIQDSDYIKQKSYLAKASRSLENMSEKGSNRQRLNTLKGCVLDQCVGWVHPGVGCWFIVEPYWHLWIWCLWCIHHSCLWCCLNQQPDSQLGTQQIELPPPYSVRSWFVWCNDWTLQNCNTDWS